MQDSKQEVTKVVSLVKYDQKHYQVYSLLKVGGLLRGNGHTFREVTVNIVCLY